jgi:hypothetical protein
MIENFKLTQIFKNSFENKCIRLFVEAYKQFVKDELTQLNWQENDITNQLHEYIDKNPLRFKWSISTNVEQHLTNKTVRKEKGFANKDLRIDLRFVTFNSEKEYKTFFEAKNLKEKDDDGLKKRYIKDGIGNFVNQKYPYGFLVGYLLEGYVKPTIDGINELLKQQNRADEILHDKNHEIVQYYYESNHSEMCLKHLIFDFTVL